MPLSNFSNLRMTYFLQTNEKKILFTESRDSFWCEKLIQQRRHSLKGVQGLLRVRVILCYDTLGEGFIKSSGMETLNFTIKFLQ